MFDVGRFSIGKIAREDVGKLDQLVPVLDAVRSEPEKE